MSSRKLSSRAASAASSTSLQVRASVHVHAYSKLMDSYGLESHSCWCPDHELTTCAAGDDSYILTVQPGADLAFFVAVTISLNDILNPDMA